MIRGVDNNCVREKRYVRGDGSVVWGRAHVTAMRDHQGRLARLQAAIEDITQARQTEEALRRSEERYRVLVDNLPFGVSWVDRDFTIQAVNQAHKTIFGEGWGSLLGRPQVPRRFPAATRGVRRLPRR